MCISVACALHCNSNGMGMIACGICMYVPIFCHTAAAIKSSTMTAIIIIIRYTMCMGTCCACTCNSGVIVSS